MMRLSALVVFSLGWLQATASWCTSCSDVCTNYGYAKQCASPSCTVQGTSCGRHPSSCNNGVPWCGYCACNFFGCNCDPCGQCNTPESERSNTTNDNHGDYFGADAEKRLKHLGQHFHCGGGSVTQEFEDYLMTVADQNKDGVVSKEEFDNTHYDVDLTDFPLEKRCSKEAFIPCGDIKHAYKEECCGQDADKHSDTFDTPCAHVKAHYKHEECCGNPEKSGTVPL